MKRAILTSVATFLAVLMIANCRGSSDSRRDATTTGAAGWVYEGWACAPDQTKALQGLSPGQYCDSDEDENDYLYMKFLARASANAVAKRSIAMMNSTCRNAVEKQIQGQGIQKAIGEYLEQAAGVVDGESTGFAIMTESSANIKGVGVYDCCSLDKKTGTCVEEGAPETWEECMCVGYLRFQGGRDALITEAQRLSN